MTRICNTQTSSPVVWEAKELRCSQHRGWGLILGKEMSRHTIDPKSQFKPDNWNPEALKITPIEELVAILPSIQAENAYQKENTERMTRKELARD